MSTTTTSNSSSTYSTGLCIQKRDAGGGNSKIFQDDMGNSSSSSEGDGEWKSEIYFDPESDETRGTTYKITDDELRTRMTALVDPEERILEVFMYKIPLSESQWTNLLFNHQFIIFETDSFWWSIEKNDAGLTVQRSKKKDAVLRRYRQKPRIEGSYWDVQLIEKDKGRRTMGELIEWLWKKDHLNKKYDWLTSNCKDFAQFVFNEIAQNKNV